MPPDGVVPISPADPVGSPRLAAALASGEAEAIGRALRMDIVVVPLVRAADGTTQIRVTRTDDGRLDLVLFSSSSTLAQFLHDASAREFDVRRGPELAPFLEAHRANLARVVFDPAGPHPVAAPVDAVIDALRHRPDDDEVGWITQSDTGSGARDEASPVAGDVSPAGDVSSAGNVSPAGNEAPPSGTAGDPVDYRWAMPLRGWVRVVPDELRGYPDRMTSQLAKAARRLPRAQRDAVAAWVTATALAAAREDALREVASISEGRGDGAFVIVATRSWHPAGPSSDGDFDAAVARLAAGLNGDDELVSSGDAFVAPTVRHTRTVVDPSVSDGQVAIVEYLLAFPGGRGFCRARFLTPQSGRRADLVRETAPIVAGGQWVTRGAR